MNTLTNSLCATVEEAQATLREDGVATTPVPGSAGPRLRRTSTGRHARLPAGMVTPQSRGSQLAGAVAAWGVPAGGAVADLCAAPGTKTSQLAAALPTAASWRWIGPGPSHRPAQESRSPAGAAGDRARGRRGSAGDGDVGQFESVLVDAPCTGLGTLASRPDLRWRRRPADIARLAALQGVLLERAAYLVRPRGTLTYSVCTVTRAETLDVVAALAAGDGGSWTTSGRSGRSSPTRAGLVCLLTLPSTHGTSGFFIARLHNVSPEADKMQAERPVRNGRWRREGMG